MLAASMSGLYRSRDGGSTKVSGGSRHRTATRPARAPIGLAYGKSGLFPLLSDL
jgi:hypothetical protein